MMIECHVAADKQLCRITKPGNELYNSQFSLLQFRSYVFFLDINRHLCNDRKFFHEKFYGTREQQERKESHGSV